MIVVGDLESMIAAKANQAASHPLALVLLLLSIVYMLAKPACWAPAIALLFSFFVCTNQRFIVAGFDVTFYRVLFLSAVARLWLENGQNHRFQAGWPDACVLSLASLAALIGIVRPHEASAMLAYAGNCILYFLTGRFGVRSTRDWEIFCAAVSRSALAVAFVLIIEHFSGVNMFGRIFGGVPETTIVRGGSLRAQGAFDHPIVAGMCLAIGFVLNWSRVAVGRVEKTLIAAASCVGVLLTASSTPLLMLLSGVGMVSAFRLRSRLAYAIPGVLIAGLVIACIGSEAISRRIFVRGALISGSTGWHRYLLYADWRDSIGDWWLLGSSDRSAGWAVRLAEVHGDAMVDVTSEYVLLSVNFGIFGLLSMCCLVCGIALPCLGRSALASNADSRRAFAIYVILVTYCVGGLACALFGQIQMLVWVLLGAGAATLERDGWVLNRRCTGK